MPVRPRHLSLTNYINLYFPFSGSITARNSKSSQKLYRLKNSHSQDERTRRIHERSPRYFPAARARRGAREIPVGCSLCHSVGAFSSRSSLVRASDDKSPCGYAQHPPPNSRLHPRSLESVSDDVALSWQCYLSIEIDGSRCVRPRLRFPGRERRIPGFVAERSGPARRQRTIKQPEINSSEE